MAERVTCNRCGRPLSPDKRRYVPVLVAVPASAAAAFLHAGLWAREELAKPYCERDRNVIVAGAVGATAAMLAAASFGVALWLGGPRW
jgi:hypothetical protein